MLQELRKICSISLLAVLLQTFSVQALAFNYGTDKIRGVSLGGWLLLEPFITPQIFLDTKDDNVIDEYTYGLKYGSAGAAARLKSHWWVFPAVGDKKYLLKYASLRLYNRDTFITETDIATIKSYGLNHVRIPIGYWSLNKLPSEPYAVGAYPYFKKAVGWCQKYGLKVIIDLHGAPGSQNGFDK
jgi:glucan 1,3-beta-glucosidase